MIKSVSIVSMKDYETQINGQVCKSLTRNNWSVDYRNIFGLQTKRFLCKFKSRHGFISTLATCKVSSYIILNFPI